MTNEEIILRSIRAAIGGADERRGTDTVSSLLQAILCSQQQSATAGILASNIEIIHKCDDTLNDGSVIVQYVEVYSHIVDSAGLFTSSLIGTYTDHGLQTAYTPLFGKDCNSIGAYAKYMQGRLSITGGDWSPTALTKSYSIYVESTTGGLPTFQDSFGNITNLKLGSITSYNDEELLADTTPVVQVPAGSEIIIAYVQIN
jgi:hypothetical protein